MKKTLFGLIALLLFGFIAVPAISGAYADAPVSNETVTNESLDPDVGNWTPVEQSREARSFEDNETVFANGTTATEGTDYEWSTENGSVYAYPGGILDGAENASITYTYTAGNEVTVAGRETLFLVFKVFGVLALAIGGLVTMGFAGQLFAGGASR